MSEKVIRNHTINYQSPPNFIIHVNLCALNTVCSYGLICSLQESKTVLSKTPTPGMRSPHLSCWSGLFKSFPKHEEDSAVCSGNITGYCYCSWLPPPERWEILLKTPYTPGTGPYCMTRLFLGRCNTHLFSSQLGVHDRPKYRCYQSS